MGLTLHFGTGGLGHSSSQGFSRNKDRMVPFNSGTHNPKPSGQSQSAHRWAGLHTPHKNVYVKHNGNNGNVGWYVNGRLLYYSLLVLKFLERKESSYQTKGKKTGRPSLEVSILFTRSFIHVANTYRAPTVSTVLSAGTLPSGSMWALGSLDMAHAFHTTATQCARISRKQCGRQKDP